MRLRESSILPEEAKEAQQKLKEVMGQKDWIAVVGWMVPGDGVDVFLFIFG